MSSQSALKFFFLLLFLVVVGVSAADPMSDLARSIANAPSDWKPGSDPCKWTGVGCTSSQVTSLNLASRSLSGSLPPSFSSLTSLQTVALQNNDLSGSLPSVAGMSSLQKLFLDGNRFSSLPSDFFSGLSALQDLSLDDNPLSPWSLPDDLSQCTSLRAFSASNASISGPLPDFLGQLPGLQDLRLSYNSLTGPLPASFAGSSIKNLWLNNQKSDARLSGRIDVVGAMDQLSLLWLQSNAFTGPIPDLSNLTSLASFNVRDNSLTGPVPASLAQAPALRNASLANNCLQGPMPAFGSGVAADVGKGNAFCGAAGEACDPRVDVLLAVAGGFGYPVALAQQWGGNDPCGGKWPGVTCDPQGKDVVVLNLASQKLVGTISPDVAKLTALQKLVLSNNNLTGTIPDTLAGLKSLQLLDVSNNDLSGKVPNFDKSVTVKLSGNPSIGKDVSPGDGGSSGSLPSGSNGDSSGSTSASDGKQKTSTGLIVGIVVAVIVIVGCLAGLIYYLNRKKREQEFWKVQTKTPPNEQDVVKIGINDVSMGARSELYSQGSNDNVSTIPIEELQRATEYFNDANVIGRGGFGVVYKGMLNGTPIAVKRNESQVMGKTGMAEFEAEVHVLQKTRHRHLVSFLGYCRDNCERLLVYEYMPEGTLGQHLFDREGGKYCPLNWRQRLVIALDVARGIEYLHSLAQESFIHRDLKPSNILLDKDLRAKVSDFGLVKLVDKEKSVMTRLAGTFGYLAPEYALTGKVSTKVDVYAYGVILMELITGRKAIDESVPDEDSHLVMAFRRHIINKDKFLNYVDPSLDLDAEAHENIFHVSELARHCTAREPNQRPSMGHAVQVLSPLVDQWVPSKSNFNLDEDDKNMSLTRTLAKWQSDDDTFSTSFTHNGSTSTFMS